MSYSFSIRAATTALALAAVGVEFDKIVATQPIHARDRDTVTSAVGSALSLMAEDDTKDVEVRVHGSVGWDWKVPLESGKEATHPLSSFGAGINVTLVERTPAA